MARAETDDVRRGRGLGLTGGADIGCAKAGGIRRS
jgi:hypothetical protein